MTDTAALSRYDEGVQAIVSITKSFGADEWSRPACGAWTATDLAGHVLGVIGWYHAWLDRALAGEINAPWPVEQMDEQNRTALASIDVASGPERIERFASEADRYRDRAAGHFDVAYGYPRGTVTVGGHFEGAATLEWHIHAWDFAQGAYEPADAGALLRAGAALQFATQPKLVGALQRPFVAPAAKRNPWQRVLKASGRAS